MEKYAILLGYFDKQLYFIKKIHAEIISVEVSIYANRYLWLFVRTRVALLYS